MNVTLQIRVPIDLASMLRDRLANLQHRHRLEVRTSLRAIQKCKVVAPEAMAAHRALLERGKKITIGTLVRLTLRLGSEAVRLMPITNLLAAVSEETVTRGRPSGHA